MIGEIRNVAVLGAGVMGSRIAAHLASAGISIHLLDIIPEQLSEEDKKRGLTATSPAFRNRLAMAGIDKAKEARPAAFSRPEDAEMITLGNFEDHMHRLADADWIIEAIVEDLAIKKATLKGTEKFRSPNTIVSTSTSGLSINKMAEEVSPEFAEHFLGTHFFNPPRYMKLVEIIPCRTTKKDIVDSVMKFCEGRLGKSVVLAKDTPNFIANRIGVYGLITAIRTMVEDGYTLEEVDAITGPPMGRPKSATFRMADLVGLDVIAHSAKNVCDNVEDEKEKAEFVIPDLVGRMVDMGLLGDKTGKGFYRKAKMEKGSEIHVIDYGSLDYAPQRTPALPLLDNLRRVKDPAERIRSLVYSEDRAGQFGWKMVESMLLYSASKIPEIADSILDVDRAMKWAFNWELGPFEIWDAIGVQESVERMEREGEEIPGNIEQMLLAGNELFYEPRDEKLCCFDFGELTYREIKE